MGTYNYNKGKKYDPTTYTNFEPEQEKIPLWTSELDNKYRKIVITTIDKNVKEGKDIKRVIKGIVYNPRIKKHFEYLTKAGINLEEAFQSWYEQYLENQKRDRNAEGMNFKW